MFKMIRPTNCRVWFLVAALLMTSLAPAWAANWANYTWTATVCSSPDPAIVCLGTTQDFWLTYETFSVEGLPDDEYEYINMMEFIGYRWRVDPEGTPNSECLFTPHNTALSNPYINAPDSRIHIETGTGSATKADAGIHTIVIEGSCQYFVYLKADPQQISAPIVTGWTSLTKNIFDTETHTFNVVTMELRNPIDTNGDSQVNDFAGDTGNRTGNAFNYDRSLPNNLCSIPCRVKLEPDTTEVRTMFADKMTVTLTDISNTSFTSTLTWDHSVYGDPDTGILIYNPTSTLWEATATFTGLPNVPADSRGYVPKGLHDLLYGNRTATVTIQNLSGGGTFCTKSTNYEVYFGDSLTIGGIKMAETTLNFMNHIDPLVGGNTRTREIFDKMNCSTQVFSFADDTKASQNFTMRYKAVEIMDTMNLGTLSVDYCKPSATPPIHPRAGATTYNTTTMNWTIGTYWTPKNASNGWCTEFSQMSATSAHSAINNVTPFLGECVGAMEICLFQASDTTLGASVFDTVHVSGSITVGDFGSDFDKHQAVLNDQVTLVPGDYLYMHNKDDYLTWSPTGFWQGENCLYMGLNTSDAGLFSGLGEHRKTESELREDMRVAYTTDCSPHTVTNPTTEIRFTVKNRTITGD